MKHLKDSNLQHLPKRRFLYNAIPIILFASLLGTYLDLFFVGKGLYEFPKRPFAASFSINIFFTLFTIPLLTLIYLLLMKKLNRPNKVIFILLISSMVPIIEVLSEYGGFFHHSEKWSHGYSSIGYLFFFLIIWKGFKWTNNRS